MWKPFLMAALTVVLGLSAASAQAQAPAGYYYSPGGYSGGRYFQPGYYARPATRVAPVSSRAFTRTVRHYPISNDDDWSTGRSNYPVPLTKPWMQPR